MDWDILIVNHPRNSAPDISKHDSHKIWLFYLEKLPSYYLINDNIDIYQCLNTDIE